MKDMQFEDAIKELEELVSRLERGDLKLDESLEAFQKGIELSRICNAKLEGAERKIDLLLQGKDGTITLKEQDLDIE